MLLLHLQTKEKNHFLLSVVLIIIGSLIFQVQENFEFTYLLFFFALLFSFVGDLFMARKLFLFESRIINGIIGFGMAHLFYLLAFYNLGSKRIHLLEISIGLLLLVLVYYFVVYSPDMKKPLKIASFIYAGIISSLFVVILNFVLYSDKGLFPSLLSLVGIVLFIISDSTIAYTEFKKNISNSSKIIAITYILSQIMLQATVVLVGDI